jgi:hypothetical protein
VKISRYRVEKTKMYKACVMRLTPYVIISVVFISVCTRIPTSALLFQCIDHIRMILDKI